MKKATAILCALFMILGTVHCFAEDDVGYNYKLSFEDESEFTNKYGWASAHPTNPNFPDTLKPTATIVSDGKYGNAYKIVNPFFYCENYYGVTWRVELKQVITPMPGFESETLLDYMKGVKSINYWVKVPYSEAVRENIAANTRRTRMTIEALIAAPTDDNPNRTKSASFRADVRLINTDEWQYVQIPIDCFVSGGLPILDYYDDIIKFRYLDFDFYNDKSFFGELPQKPVLNADKTVAEDAPSWNDRSKDVPILIDEMVFDRSTADRVYHTKPSPGEEDGLTDANLESVYICGEKADAVIDGDSVTVRLMPSVKELGDDDIEFVPEFANVTSDFNSDSVKITVGGDQIHDGATCEYTLPGVIPGTGSLTVIAGDGITCKRYKLNFVHSEGVVVGEPTISGLTDDGKLAAGRLDIGLNLKNADGNGHCVTVVAEIIDGKNGVVRDLAVRNISEFGGGAEETISVTMDVPEHNTEYCTLKIYVFDDIAKLNLAHEPFIFGYAAK